MHDEVLKQSQNFSHLSGGNAPDPNTWGFTPLSCLKEALHGAEQKYSCSVHPFPHLQLAANIHCLQLDRGTWTVIVLIHLNTNATVKLMAIDHQSTPEVVHIYREGKEQESCDSVAGRTGYSLES